MQRSRRNEEEVLLRLACIRWSNDHTALAVRTLATSRGRCHGINDGHLRRGAGGGSPLSFLAQVFRTLIPSSAASVAWTSTV
jgi:hypothetical protein